jgi:hypothetical protein
VGREQTVEVAGEALRLGRLTRRVWAEFLAWAKGVLPNPLAVAKEQLAGLGEKEAASLVSAALYIASGHLSVTDQRVLQLRNSPEGLAQLLLLLLRPAHPSATEDLAWAVLQLLGENKVQELLRVAEGRYPPLAPPPGPGAPPSSPAPPTGT